MSSLCKGFNLVSTMGQIILRLKCVQIEYKSIHGMHYTLTEMEGRTYKAARDVNAGFIGSARNVNTFCNIFARRVKGKMVSFSA